MLPREPCSSVEPLMISRPRDLLQAVAHCLPPHHTPMSDISLALHQNGILCRCGPRSHVACSQQADCDPCRTADCRHHEPGDGPTLQALLLTITQLDCVTAAGQRSALPGAPSPCAAVLQHGDAHATTDLAGVFQASVSPETEKIFWAGLFPMQAPTAHGGNGGVMQRPALLAWFACKGPNTLPQPGRGELRGFHRSGNALTGVIRQFRWDRTTDSARI